MTFKSIFLARASNCQKNMLVEAKFSCFLFLGKTNHEAIFRTEIQKKLVLEVWFKTDFQVHGFDLTPTESFLFPFLLNSRLSLIVLIKYFVTNKLIYSGYISHRSY